MEGPPRAGRGALPKRERGEGGGCLVNFASGAEKPRSRIEIKLPSAKFCFIRGGVIITIWLKVGCRIVGSHSYAVIVGFNLMRVSIYFDLFLMRPSISNASPDTLIVIGCVRPVAGRPVPNAVPGVCCLSFIYKNITL